MKSHRFAIERNAGSSHPSNDSTLGALIPSFARTPRVAFGGIAGECSTYSRLRVRLDDLTVLRGQNLLDCARFDFLKRHDFPFEPTLFAVAGCGGPLERETYDTIKAEFLERIASLLPLDGVFLSMHGALNVVGLDDAEGDWYESLRALVGDHCLLAAQYDLHGNISQRIIDNLDIVSAYRTAPRVDHVETGMRVTGMLSHCLRHKIRPTLAWARIPVLLSSEQSATEWQPGRRLWSDLAEFSRLPGILDVSQLVGYAWADEPRTAAAVVVTGTDLDAQRRVATEVAQRYWDARFEFDFDAPSGSVTQCVAMATATPKVPVAISDAGDNPGCGGNGDQTFLLQALLDADARDVLFGGMIDRPATDACYEAGVGAQIRFSVGATLDPEMCAPIVVDAVVSHLTQVENPRDREAVVTIDGITMTLAARRRVYHDVASFRCLGLEPSSFKIIALKCGHLAPTMKALAKTRLMALSPGVIDPDIASIANFRRLPSYPWDADLTFEPVIYAGCR